MCEILENLQGLPLLLEHHKSRSTEGTTLVYILALALSSLLKLFMGKRTYSALLAAFLGAGLAAGLLYQYRSYNRIKAHAF